MSSSVTVNGKRIQVNGRTPVVTDSNFQQDENGRIYRKYDFIKTTDIPVLDYRDGSADRIIKSQNPVILQNSGLVEPARKWTLDYLEKNIGTDGKNVYISKNHKFMYYNDKRFPERTNFIPPTKQVEMTFSEYVRRLRKWKVGDERLYYQQMLTDSVGHSIYQDFNNFNWRWLNYHVRKCGWSDLTSNLLLIGQGGNVTPAHYDEQQNFFAQVHGYKRVLLFHPKYFKCLYPYQYHHPCDRQSQVDFECPDFERFPLLKYAYGMQAVVGPGDVLYIPMYWWHYIESTMDSELTTSVNFWYKNTTLSLKDIKFPLSWQQKITMTRNVEKMLGEALGEPSEIGPFLNALIQGRYPSTDDEHNDIKH